MLLPDRRFLLLGGLALAGCGLTPVHTGDTDLFGAFTITAPKNRMGFVVKQRLEERLGRPNTPRYDLGLTISINAQRNAITADGATTRFKQFGTVKYTITDPSTGKAVTRGAVDSFVSYTNTGTTVANTIARQDARDRLMGVLADQLVSRLYAIGPSLP